MSGFSDATGVSRRINDRRVAAQTRFKIGRSRHHARSPLGLSPGERALVGVPRAKESSLCAVIGEVRVDAQPPRHAAFGAGTVGRRIGRWLRDPSSVNRAIRRGRPSRTGRPIRARRPRMQGAAVGDRTGFVTTARTLVSEFGASLRESPAWCWGFRLSSCNNRKPWRFQSANVRLKTPIFPHTARRTRANEFRRSRSKIGRWTCRAPY